MRANRVLVFATLFTAFFAFAADRKGFVSQSPIDADQIAVYRAFLAAYTKGDRPIHLNLALRTSPLALPDGTAEGYLKGISIDFANSGSETHTFDPKIPLSPSVKLVDPDEQGARVQQNDPTKTMQQGEPAAPAVKHAFASALLTLSEVAFDENHRYAVMTFTFWCGRKCGHGATLIFEKHGGKWKESKRECSSWIS